MQDAEERFFAWWTIVKWMVMTSILMMVYGVATITLAAQYMMLVKFPDTNQIKWCAEQGWVRHRVHVGGGGWACACARTKLSG